mmetsp:Transcript_114839/g.335886  ORF Transcript_114839/g.335886 Transcript_114839/m.335886 type:complete len:219 (+) Transcript_114839:347-1003(+)
MGHALFLHHLLSQHGAFLRPTLGGHNHASALHFKSADLLPAWLLALPGLAPPRDQRGGPWRRPRPPPARLHGRRLRLARRRRLPRILRRPLHWGEGRHGLVAVVRGAVPAAAQVHRGGPWRRLRALLRRAGGAGQPIPLPRGAGQAQLQPHGWQLWGPAHAHGDSLHPPAARHPEAARTALAASPPDTDPGKDRPRRVLLARRHHGAACPDLQVRLVA